MKRLTLFLACLTAGSLAFAQVGGSGSTTDTSTGTTTDTGTDPNTGNIDSDDPTSGAITDPSDPSLGVDESTNQVQDRTGFDQQQNQGAVQKLYDQGYGSSPEAIRRYQQDNGLQVTGELNAETMNSLGFDRAPAGVDEGFEGTEVDESGDPLDESYDPMDEPVESDQNQQEGDL